MRIQPHRRKTPPLRRVNRLRILRAEDKVTVQAEKQKKRRDSEKHIRDLFSFSVFRASGPPQSDFFCRTSNQLLA